MGTVELFQAVVAGGIRDTNFFNGRMLTADDLRTMQDAADARGRRMARAVGDGVAHGLEVSLVSAGGDGSGTRPTLRVTAGLAASRRGDVLELTADVDVGLIRATDLQQQALGEFTVCPPPSPTTTLQNFGLYVLTLAPASWYDGLAPMTELRNEGVGTSCGRRYEVDGVRFGLVRMALGVDDAQAAVASPPAATTLGATVRQLATELDTQLGELVAKVPIPDLERDVERKLSLLRNGVAHLCFGTEEREPALTDPFGAGSSLAHYGEVERLRAAGTLAACEVPVALIYWSVRGVEFVDGWAVRRPLLSSPTLNSWAALAAVRRAAEGVAIWLQFQRHLSELAGRRAVTLSDVRAVDYFYWLPPVGFLPLATGAAGDVEAVVAQRFFETRMKRAPVYVEAERVEALVRMAREHPPIALAALGSASPPAELIWLYRVTENIEAYASGAMPRPRPYVLFTSGYAPFSGAAEFDLAHWSYASYA